MGTSGMLRFLAGGWVRHWEGEKQDKKVRGAVDPTRISISATDKDEIISYIGDLVIGVF